MMIVNDKMLKPLNFIFANDVWLFYSSTKVSLFWWAMTFWSSYRSKSLHWGNIANDAHTTRSNFCCLHRFEWNEMKCCHDSSFRFLPPSKEEQKSIILQCNYFRTSEEKKSSWLSFRSVSRMCSTNIDRCESVMYTLVSSHSMYCLDNITFMKSINDEMPHKSF